MDIVFNAVLIPLDLLVWAVVGRSKRPRTCLLGIAVGLLSALLVVALAQRGLFHLMRLHAYVLFAHVPLVLVGIAWSVRTRSRWWSALSLAGAVLLWVVAADAFLIEPRSLEVTQVEVRSAKVTHALRVVVVADLQTDRVDSYERRALQTALDADPDLILMPGDFLHDNSPARRRKGEDLNALLVELNFGARQGAYAVRGNTDRDDWTGLFAGSRVTPLTRTATLSVDEIDLTGLALRDSFDTALRIDGSERFHLVFGHAPDFALGQVEADLLVAGHTHGGQVRLPLIGPIVTFSAVPRAWAAGVTSLPRGGKLVVSRGIGMERGRAPRLRFLCRPEIVVIDILPAT